MPELPEVETTLRGISPHLLHQTIRQVIVRQGKLRWTVHPQLSQQLFGKSIQRCHRRAKYLLLDIDQGVLIIHLGMSGSLRIFKDNIPEPNKHDHVDIILSNETVLRYHDPRRFGAILWFENKDLNNIPLLSHLGPEPLESEFTGEYLFKALKSQSRAIKLAIMDNAVVVGIGNIYANESLFLAGIRPTHSAKSLRKKDCENLVTMIKKVLLRAIEVGGSTLKDFVDSEGKKGYFQQEYNVYGRDGEPCKVCATPIKKTVIGQRGSFFCPTCQK